MTLPGAPAQHSSRSYASIVRQHPLNIPNGILLFFGVLRLTFGSWKDALFLGIPRRPECSTRSGG
jgi:hypothetical protein